MTDRRDLLCKGFLVLALILGVFIWSLSPAIAVAQGPDEAQVLRGEEKFQQSCAVCHTIGEGVRIGPDLKGVTERREEQWLKTHILSPSVQHKENDPISAANREEYGMQMPDLGLNEQEVEAVIAYLKTGNVAGKTSSNIPTEYGLTLALSALAIVGFTVIGLRFGTKKVEVR